MPERLNIVSKSLGTWTNKFSQFQAKGQIETRPPWFNKMINKSVKEKVLWTELWAADRQVGQTIHPTQHTWN